MIPAHPIRPSKNSRSGAKGVWVGGRRWWLAVGEIVRRCVWEYTSPGLPTPTSFTARITRRRTWSRSCTGSASDYRPLWASRGRMDWEMAVPNFLPFFLFYAFSPDRSLWEIVPVFVWTGQCNFFFLPERSGILQHGCHFENNINTEYYCHIPYRNCFWIHLSNFI